MAELYEHPQYGKSPFDNDITLLILDKPATIGKYVSLTVCGYGTLTFWSTWILNACTTVTVGGDIIWKVTPIDTNCRCQVRIAQSISSLIHQAFHSAVQKKHLVPPFLVLKIVKIWYYLLVQSDETLTLPILLSGATCMLAEISSGTGIARSSFVWRRSILQNWSSRRLGSHW